MANLKVNSDYEIINGTDDNDYVVIEEAQISTIMTGEGNDTIWNGYSHNMSIYGGNGDDSVKSTFTKFIDGGSGNDNIDVNFGESSSSSIEMSVDGGSGNDIINIAAYYDMENQEVSANLKSIRINGGDGNDIITSTNIDNVVINAGKGNDIIELSQDIIEIEGQWLPVKRAINIRRNLNDEINISYDDKYYISTNTGDLIEIPIISYYDYHYGSREDDGINYDDPFESLKGGISSINDLNLTSKSRNEIIEYNEGDGDDTIFGLNSNNDLIINGNIDEVSIVDDRDVVLKVGNGKLILAC